MTTRTDREMVAVDMNGHRGITMNPTDISHWRYMNDWHKEQGIDREYPLSLGIVSRWECSNCLVYPDYEFTDETQTAIRAVQPCAKPEGIFTTTEFVVRSGKIVCDDDLRDVYRIPDEIDRKFASYNTNVGAAQVMEENARMGCCYTPVGNSCPSLWQTDEGTYIIASPPYHEGDDENESPEGWTPLTWFCTDLWAASMADYQDFLDKGGVPVPEDDHNGTRTVVDFPNGTYRVTHHVGEAGFDEDDSPTIYATLERIS